jgi:hypothetical protein
MSVTASITIPENLSATMYVTMHVNVTIVTTMSPQALAPSTVLLPVNVRNPAHQVVAPGYPSRYPPESNNDILNY